MNEVTRIHLGRTQFTISVEAHHELRKYLSSIEKKVGDKDVINEVELRMAELLAERGVTGDKVVLPEDITYLKDQLGKPEDFGDEEAGQHTSNAGAAETAGNKRLFRDTDNALVGGVASGIAAYFGLDPVLVRIAFIIMTLIGASGIAIYIVLWLVVPEAVTASEKLQMKGEAVTLDALKETVNKADLPGAARRVNSGLATFINGVFRFFVKLLGIALILTGLAVLFGAAFTVLYMILHGGNIFQEGLFPIGVREHWLVGSGIAAATLMAIFLIVSGIAGFRRKWPLKAWITGALGGLFLLSMVTTGALAADAAPRVQERYESMIHTTAIDNIQPFTKVVSKGEVDLSYTSAPNYAPNIENFDVPPRTDVFYPEDPAFPPAPLKPALQRNAD
jgi:phage shock protein PspC (stress-responsive transcriptional regulator)